MKQVVFLLSIFLIHGAFSDSVLASSLTLRQTKDAQPFGLVVRADVTPSADTFTGEHLADIDVTLTNEGRIPIIFESCECSFADHWVSDQPQVTIKKSADCVGDDCSDVQMLPGQSISRSITVRYESESEPHTIQFRVGFCLWGVERCTPYWSNPVTIERGSSL
jgi:hypothetical protein